MAAELAIAKGPVRFCLTELSSRRSQCSESEATRTMSQNPARSRPVPAPSRVSGGIPWWLWLILVVFGVSVVTTLVRKAIPEDPRIYVQEGMAALENGDLARIELSVQKASAIPRSSVLGRRTTGDSTQVISLKVARVLPLGHPGNVFQINPAPGNPH